MITRKITKDVQEYLRHFPSILITGARQVGKSTLAIGLGIEHYVTLDDIATYQSAKADPKGFIMSLQKPVVIDEIQRVPELFVAIKEQIDQDRTPGRFILTGSSNLQGFRNLSDSLAGRIGIIDLYAFNLAEIYGTSGNFIDHAFSGQPFMNNDTPIALERHVIEGGFPEIQSIEHPKTRMLWFASYIRTYIERDLHDVANIRNLDSFMRLYLMLALRSGNLLNKAALGRDSDLDTKTLENYLGILRNTYQISLLKPYFNNAMKRLVKMPKLFMLDSGILCHLLKITTPEALYESREKGAIYETFVMSELIKANTYAQQPVEMSFYRTSDGKEIDFILDNGTKLVAVEIKASQSVSATDFKHIKSFIAEQPDRMKQGIVMYTGERALPFGEYEGVQLWAVPVALAFTGDLVS
ncbi:ATP-binding protein [Leucothrix mucor]|uniref:ATP-binding protein n=1 Tax=Leucothrix mucor TaxID=45248 RepID=UPI0003B5F54C|nr:ATP-binding protein [Leucothrix mucor]